LNFVGNVEGYDLVTGKANVVVCDGFVGNVLVKFYEGLGRTENRWLANKLKGKLPENDIKDICDSLLKLTNVADIAGGGPIWAVNGLVIKGHGRSQHKEIASGIAQAKALYEKDIVGALKAELSAIRGRLGLIN
jgi:glycerol-3-phosphate acyltransferase PlsX